MNNRDQVNNLSFKDDFNKLSLENWEIQTFSFEENGCEMLKEQISINDSLLLIRVEENTRKIFKPYKGGEVFLKYPLLYGEFHVRMKNKIVPGTVSSFFLMNEWKKENWEHKEIDIEFLGKDLTKVQFTVHHYKDGDKNHVYKAHTHQLNFDSSLDFHDYGIFWSEDSISWFVDGECVYTEKKLLVSDPMHIRMNHWTANPQDTSGVKSWLGSVKKNMLPSIVYYDFISYKSLKQ